MNTDQVFSSVAPALADTLLDLLQLRTRDQPERVAYIFLQDGAHAETRLTYAELDWRARSIAARLQRSAAPGEPVLLLYPPGLDYLAAFFGCLYAGLVAVPAYPPHPQRPMPRLQAIIADAGATHALTTSTLLAQLEQRFTQLPDLAKLRWLATDTPLDGLAEQWQRPQVTGATLTMLQYTSGSTAAPKGVMLSHGQLLHNQRMIQAGFGHTQAAVVLGWLPLYHDMGLIGNVLQPLYLGATCILMSPVAFLQRPARWLEAITRYRATTSGGPNFAYDLCARKITPEQRASLDLSSWDLAFCGAEPVRAATLARFAEVFGPCGFRSEAFYPCYGLAEATLIVSGGHKHTPPIIQVVDAAALERDRVVAASAVDAGGRALVGCGQPLLDLRLEIVQPETLTRCASGEVGEIWVAGPSVAQGYWNQPDATAQTFGAHLADTGAGPFLRTGDLGFVQDGELFITGRLKDLIIIRGRNHYPQDIELTVEASHPLLRPGSGAAFSVEAGDDEQLVIVQEVERQGLRADLDGVIASIRQSVAEQHEVPVAAVVLIKPATIPKTSSGKIQRHACRAAFRDGRLDPVAAWHADQQPASANALDDEPSGIPTLDDPAALQAWLAAYLARACGVGAEEIAIDQPVTRYGLDSMLAIELLHGIETHTGAVLSIAALLQGPTIAQLADEIAAQRAAPLPSTEAGNTEQLAYGQRALWFLHQLAPQSTAYTIANAVQIDTLLDAAALKRAAQMLIDRHRLLRAVFPARHGEPFQQVVAQQAVAFVHEDATDWDTERLRQRLVAAVELPFDLERGPLLRIALFTQEERRHTLLLAAHHSITDFWSQALLLQELDTLYAAALAQHTPALPPTVHYGEYVAWQRALLAGPDGARLWEYWRRQLGAAPTVLNLPTDRPRPPMQTFHGAAHSFTVNPELTGTLKRFGAAQGLTLYMLLLAGFNILLHRYTGQDDLLVGSPVAGRSRATFANVVGYFVNPVALRSRCSADLTCAALLQQVRQTVLAAFEHQDFPFPLLVERLQPDRDPSRPPLIQALFALQQAPPHAHDRLAALALGIDGVEVALETLPLRSVALPQQTAQFELALVVAEVDGCLRGSWQYNTDLFDPATIEQMARHWESVLRALLADPDQRVVTLPLLSETEQRQLLAEWAGTTADYPRDQTLHGLIEAQAARSPETSAVVWEDQHLTYAELNRRANQLAHHLRGLGVGPDVCVGLCVERSLDVIIGILGILKAGGAYVPLDPRYPPERLAWMVENSGIDMLITQAALLGPEEARLPAIATRLCLDRDWPVIAQAPEQNPAPTTTAERAAYVLHTSGSTGRPKGVCCPHTGVVNVLYDFQRRQPLSPGMACSWWANLSFDVSVLEIFSALVAGGTLYIAPEEARFDGATFARWLHQHQVQSAYVPAFMLPDLSAAVDAGAAPPLRRMVVGVEPIQEQLLARLMRGMPGLQIINGYGPTETTICATLHSVDPLTAHDDITPLGTTVQNMQVYLLDRQLQPVPVGVLGEVYIGGVGLARGYVNQPDLTAERFVPDPFGEVGARLYKTGDLARYRADGRLMFAGRCDHQIKLRGYRIELGDIEQTLMQHSAVREAVVVAREDSPGQRRLVAYVVEQQNKEQQNKEQDENRERVPAGRLSSFARKQLPDYMVPSAFVVLDALPLLPSGKVDRKALPVPDAAAGPLSTDYQAPQTEIEQVIAGIWREVLGIERVGIHDNFFELGGHSLLVAQVQTRLREAFKTQLSIVDLFQYPTIQLLAERLQQQGVEQPTFQQSREQAQSRKEAMLQQARRRTQRRNEQ